MLSIVNDVVMSISYPIPLILYKILPELGLKPTAAKLLCILVNHTIETDDLTMKYDPENLSIRIGVGFYKGLQQLRKRNIVHIVGKNYGKSDDKYLILQPYVEQWNNGIYVDYYRHYMDNIIMMENG